MTVNFRYRKLGYIALQVSDIDKSTTFATDVFGLDLVGEGPDGARFFRVGPQHHDVLLVPSDHPAFIRTSWELETEADLDKAFAHYKGIGLDPKWAQQTECNALGLERAFRMVEPVLGTTWEYYARMSHFSEPCVNKLTKFQGGKHIGMIASDCKVLADFMTDNMGFLLSDYVEGWSGALLRAFPNSNHHSFAALGIPSPKPKFHHLAFMVDEIDDIGRLLNRIKRLNIPIQWGIGRHPTSGSIHLYIYDSDFFVWEYTLGMEQFPEIGAREPRRMSGRLEDLDLWGAMPDREHAGKIPDMLLS